MKNELEWSKNLLEKHPKTKEALEKWVYKQLQDVQNEMAKEAGVTEFPVVDEQKAKDYVPYSLAGNPEHYLQFFDENEMYLNVTWRKDIGFNYTINFRTIDKDFIAACKTRRLTIIAGIENLFLLFENPEIIDKNYGRTKV